MPNVDTITEKAKELQKIRLKARNYSQRWKEKYQYAIELKTLLEKKWDELRRKPQMEDIDLFRVIKSILEMCEELMTTLDGCNESYEIAESIYADTLTRFRSYESRTREEYEEKALTAPEFHYRMDHIYLQLTPFVDDQVSFEQDYKQQRKILELESYLEKTKKLINNFIASNSALKSQLKSVLRRTKSLPETRGQNRYHNLSESEDDSDFSASTTRSPSPSFESLSNSTPSGRSRSSSTPLPLYDENSRHRSSSELTSQVPIPHPRVHHLRTLTGPHSLGRGRGEGNPFRVRVRKGLVVVRSTPGRC